MLSNIEIKNFIYSQNNAQSGLFESISEDSIQHLLKNSSVQTFDTGKLIVQQGDTPTYIYMIIEGLIRTFRINDNGEEATIRLLTKGETCMEAVMFMGGPSPIYVEVMEEAKLLLIPEAIVKKHVLEDSQFSTNLLRIVASHYKNAMHQIDAMNIKSPLQRVGYYFLTKHIENGNKSLDIQLPFKKQVVANYLGMTPETFSRTLKQLKSIGISVEGDKISLKDSYVLCNFCDIDTAVKCPNKEKENCSFCQLDN